MELLDFTLKLMSSPSITPNDAGCQTYIIKKLEPLNFKCETFDFDGVENLWATVGEGSPLFVFSGHTDVVPTGPEEQWTSPPFEPEIRNGYLYGRGAVDMKGAVAAMVFAVEEFLQTQPKFHGTIGFAITADEEGPAINGTKKIVEILKERKLQIDYCIVGEPSCDDSIGDQIRVGRRGSLHGKLRIIGKQGHVAYPDLASNPIHHAGSVIETLSTMVWDEGNKYYPPTTFQISNIHAGTGVSNIIPGHVDINFNFRFSTASKIEDLQQRVEAVLKDHELDFEIDWKVGAVPFLTKIDTLVKASDAAITKIIGKEPRHSTAGGTSDGRFISPTGAQVIELGLCNPTAHKIDECTKVEDLTILKDIYLSILKNLML